MDFNDVFVSEPFDASNLTMDSYNGQLVIHSARLRYRTEDGKRHQSNITFRIDMKSMTPLYKSGEWPLNHVSHSFATYVRFDQDRIVYTDHGDAYPRSIVLQVEQGGMITRKVDLLRFPGEIGDNYTGAYLGGLEVAPSNYLVVGSNSDSFKKDIQNVFLSVIPKTADSDPKTIWITNHTPDSGFSISETYLCKINENKFVLLWKEYNNSTREQVMYYAVVDGQGTLLHNPTKLAGVPSPGNMTPLIQGNTITWYFSIPNQRQKTNMQDVIEFYTLHID